MGFIDLWRWKGRVDQKSYAIVGITAFFLKRLIDELISRRLAEGSGVFLFRYWETLGINTRISQLSRHQATYLSVMLVAAMPFIWLGVAMTTKRLRDGGWRTWLAALFFVPVLNAVFLATLCFVPSVEGATGEKSSPWPGPRVLDRIFPTVRQAVRW